jgi:membrane protease YdiL (CAAX protease family)
MEGRNERSEQGPGPTPSWREPAAVWATVTLIISIAYRARGAPLVRDNLHALVALLFLGVPQLLLSLRPPTDPREDYGLRLAPLGRGLLLGAGAMALFLPLYAVGFYLWFKLGCGRWPLAMAINCARVAHPTWGLPPDWALVALGQLLVVAIPEELFFRGYLMTRLEEALPGGRRLRLWGVDFGRGTLLGCALFALGHLAVTFEPATLATFVPALAFSWLFGRTRSVVAGALFHAACNVTVDVLAFSLLR